MVTHAYSPSAPPSADRPRLRMVGSFVQKPVAMLYDLTLDPLDKLVWEVIADQSWKTGECQVPHLALAAMIGRKPRTLQDSLKKLIERGLLGSRRLGQTQAKAYWPLNPYDDADAAAAHTQNIAGVHPVDGARHTQNIAATPAKKLHDTGKKLPDLKKKTPEYPEDRSPVSKIPVVPDLPVPEPAADAAPAPSISRVPDDASGPSAPPKSPARQRTLPPDIQAGVTEVWDYYRARIQPKARVYTASKIANRLRTFSVAEIKAGIDRFAADPWWMERCSGQGADWFFGTDAQVERWINLVPRAPGGAGNGRDRLVSNGHRPQGVGKPLGPIDADIAETGHSWRPL